MKKGTLAFSLCIVLCMAYSSNTFSQNNNQVKYTPALNIGDVEKLVTEDFIANNCIEIFNVTLNQGVLGNSATIGSFSNGMQSLGMDNGLVIATAPVSDFGGGNSSSSIGGNAGSAGTDNDLQLIDIVYGGPLPVPVQDLTTLEFDFIPTAEKVSFKYVFASEEYCEWVGTQFNDKFALFLGGPGIDGPFTDGNLPKINLAEIIDEDTNLPVNVAINNVHAGRNSAYYVDNTTVDQTMAGGGNCFVSLGNVNPNTNFCQFDGYTVPLVAEFDQLEICGTYHVKLVVADGSDRVWGSAVFLQGGSFNAAQGAGVTDITFGDTGETFTYESCGDSVALVEFTREPVEGTDANADIFMPIEITGNAVYGLDYCTELPIIGDITLGPFGLFEEIIVKSDNFDEGTEEINISIQNPCFCEPEEYLLEIIDVPPIEVSLLEGDTTCFGFPTTLSVNVEGGFPSVDRATPVADYEYQWSDETGVLSTDEEFDVDLAAQGSYTYFLEVSDGCGAMHFDTVNFVTSGIPDAELEGEFSVCDESPNATLDLALTGEGPFTLEYTIDGVAQPPLVIEDATFEFIVSVPGTYEITRVSGPNCDRVVDGMAIVSPQSFELDVMPTPTLCADSEDGMLMATVTGGMGNYEYLWSDADAQDTEMATGLAPGSYTVTVTDELGCIQEFTQMVPAAAVVNVMPSEVSGTTCADANSGEVSALGDGGAGGFTYEWFDNGGESVGSGADLGGLAAGVYEVVATDANGCPVAANVTVTSDENTPDAFAVSAVIDCNNMSVVIDTDGTTIGTDIVYTWTVNSGGGSVDSDAGLPIATISDPGSYTLTVTNTTNGCSATAPFEVTSDMVDPIADPGQPGIIDCNISDVMLGGSDTSTGDDITYEWQLIPDAGASSTASTQTISATEAGTYILTVTNGATGCTATEQVVVTESLEDPIVVIADPALLTCETDNQTLSSAGSSMGDFTYTWTTDDGNITSSINDQNVEVDDPGTYTLTIVNNVTGCEEFATTTVAEDAEFPNVQIAAPTNIDCADNLEVMLDGSGSDSGPGILYTWTNEAGMVVGSTASIQVDAEGTYTLEVNNTITGCIENESQVVIDIREDPVADPGQPASIDCINSDVALGGPNTSTGSDFSYEWQIVPNSGASSTASTQNITATDPGTYTLLVTNNTNGCTAMEQVVITDDIEDPIVAISDPALLTCEAGSQILSSAGSSNNGDFTYTWTTDGGTIVSSVNEPNAEINDPGTYTLTIVNNTNGCEDFQTVTVIEDAEFPNVVVNTPENIDCSNTQAFLDGTGSDTGPGIEYTWTDESGAFVSDQISVMVDEEGTYTLEVNNTLTGCIETEPTMVIDLTEDPIADAGLDQTLDCENTVLNIGGTTTSVGSEFSYSWTLVGGAFTSSEANPEITEDGEYILVVTNSLNQCSTEESVIIDDNMLSPDISIDVTGVITCEDPIQVLESTGSSTGGEFEYLWTGPDGFTSAEENPEITLAGPYELTITNTLNNCEETRDLTVEEDAEFPAIFIEAPGIVNCENTIIELSGLGSEVGPDITYEWVASGTGVIEDDEDSLNPEISAAGTYTLTVSNDVTGCSRMLEVVVADDFVEPIAMVNADLTFGCQDDILDISGLGSSTGPEFEYSWTAGQGNVSGPSDQLDSQIDQTGDYTLLVTNITNGCTAEATFLVVPDADLPQILIDDPLAITCDRDMVLIDASASDTGTDLQYEWTLDGDPYTPSSEESFMVDQPGAYTLTITNTINGCISMGTTTVGQEIEPPLAEAGNLMVLDCRDMMLNLDADGSSSGADFSYDWIALDGGNIVSGANTDEPLIDEPGSYLLTVTNMVTGCVSTDEVVIERNDTAPVVAIADAGTLNCKDAIVMLDANSSDQGTDFEFEWEALGTANIESGEQTLTPMVDEPGTYVLTITDSRNSCVNTFEVIVEQDMDEPVAEVVQPTDLTCSQLTVPLIGSGSSEGAEFSYTWTSSTGGSFTGLTNDIDAEVDEPGTYELLVVNTENFCEATFTVTVGEDIDEPTAVAGDAQEVTCENLEATLSGAGSSTGGDFEYSWTPLGTGVIVSGNTTLTPVVNAPGMYELTVLNTTNGCIDTDIQEVTSNDVFPTDDAPVPGLLTCSVSEQVLAGTGNPGLTYEWSGENIPGTIAGAEITVDQPGIYVMTVTDIANGCSTPYQINVEEDVEAPMVDAGPSSTLTCTVTEVALAGTGSEGSNFTYEWTTTVGAFTGSVDQLQAQATSAGAYTLTIIDNNNDCVATDLVNIEVDPNVPSDIIAEAISPDCFGDPGAIDIMDVEGGVGPFVYSIDGGDSFTDETVFTNLAPGQTYDLLIEDANGCVIQEELAIPAVDSLAVQVAEPMVEIELGEGFDINAFVTIPEDEITSVSWSPSIGLSCDDCLNPEATPGNSINYTVTVVSENGCIDEASVQFRVDRNIDIYIPNAFSPHNIDGINDLFAPLGKPNLVAQVTDFQIYDRWGNQVFFDGDFEINTPGRGWDGVFRTEKMQPGVFVYYIVLEYVDGSTELFEGDVTLMD